jgi:hypothetical protein
MSVLDLDTARIRAAADGIDAAADALMVSPLSPGAAVAADPVSAAAAANLGAHTGHLGEVLAGAADYVRRVAAELRITADAFDRQDAANAAPLAPTPAAAATPADGASPAPPTPVPAPPTTPTPHVAGQDAHIIARQLETGPGPGPVTATGGGLAQWSAAAAAAATALQTSATQLAGAGAAQFTAPAVALLSGAAEWASRAAAHAQGLSTAHTTHAVSYSTARTVVPSSEEFDAVKAALDAAIAENQATGGLAQAKVDALTSLLRQMQAQADAGMSAYETDAGTLQGLPDATTPGKPHSALTDNVAPAAAQLPGSVVSTLGQLPQSLGQLASSNPLSSLMRAGGQLPHPPTHTPSLPAHTGQHPGGGAKKPAGLGGGIKAASLGAGAPTASPRPTTPAAAPAAAPAASGVGGSGSMGSGMVPMGAAGQGKRRDAKKLKNTYGDMALRDPPMPTHGPVDTAAVSPEPVTAADAQVRDRVAERLAALKELKKTHNG